MTSNSSLEPLNAEELAEFGQARVQGLAFDAVHRLWRLLEVPPDLHRHNWQLR